MGFPSLEILKTQLDELQSNMINCEAGCALGGALNQMTCGGSFPTTAILRLKSELYSKQGQLVQIAQGLTQETFNGLQTETPHYPSGPSSSIWFFDSGVIYLL